MMSGTTVKKFVVKNKTRSAKYNTDKVKLEIDGMPGRSPFYLYKRKDGSVSFAQGDMAATVVAVKEAVLQGRDYKFDGKTVSISKKNFSQVSKDFKNATPGQEKMVVLDPKSQGTISAPVKFTEEDNNEVDEACWDSHKQVGMKTKNGKQVPNCVPKEETEDPDIGDRKGSQPANYHKGLAKSTKTKRDAQFKKQAKMDDDDPKAYKPAPGDKNAETKPSKHTKKYDKMFGENIQSFSEYNLDEDATKGLKAKAEKSGMSLGILRQVYNRGVAAWKTGHRPGTTPQQWGFARVNSFVTKSSGTWGKADKDLASKVRG
jgi:hypothetical protein